MYTQVRPGPHTQTERGLRFPPHYHISYKWVYCVTPLYIDVFSPGVMSSEQANNNPGLCPIKGH